MSPSTRHISTGIPATSTPRASAPPAGHGGRCAHPSGSTTAAIDGAGPIRIFWRIMLPLVAPGLVATSVFAFIFAWNEFSFASILATTSSKPLPVKISAAMGATGMEWTQIFAAGVVLVVPVAIFFYLIRKYLLIGMTFGVLGKTAR